MNLTETLPAILSSQPPPAAVKSFVVYCQRMGLVYLKRKIRAGTLRPAFIGLSVHDLAFDCIGVLFERDGRNRFPQLETYYARSEWASCTEEELVAATRRLVFSTVNQEICRRYREADPSLERLIRNLRNALRSSAVLCEERRGNELWITMRRCDGPPPPLPLMTQEFLESHLTPHLLERTTLPEALQSFAGILDSQPFYRKSFPLTLLALTIRSAYAKLGAAPDHDEGALLLADEIRIMIQASLSEIESQMFGSYVAKGKLDENTYRLLFRAVDDILQAEYVMGDGDGQSFYRVLSAHIPQLDKQTYQENYRCHLEYLVKLARKRLLGDMKKELSAFL